MLDHYMLKMMVLVELVHQVHQVQLEQEELVIRVALVQQVL